MNVGNAIKQIRRAKKLTQSEVAKGAGISQTAFSQIETGASDPHKKTLEAIATALGTKVSVIALLAIDASDVAENKKEAYNKIMPSLRKLMLQLLEGDPDEVIV